LSTAVTHRYRQAPLPPGDPAFVARVPGAREVLRLFPEPSLSGRGSLGVEGGITLVAGPGMGRTSLLAHVQQALESERRIPCARIRASPASAARGFQAFLGELAEEARLGLLRSPPIEAPEHAPLKAALQAALPGDVAGQPGQLTPRGLQGWIDGVGRAAAQGHGCALLFDGLDAASGTDWSGALVAGLRFTFQAAAGVTPIFALWNLYFEESMPGSNYFRNVTRPLFVSALEPAERDALIDLDLSALPPAARAGVGTLAGGHPALLQRLLGALAATGDVAGLDAAGLEARLAPVRVELVQAARALLARVPQLQPALRKLETSAVAYAALPRSLLTAGLVDRATDGNAVLPGLVRAAL
jgi:hypothetical protein